MVMLDVAMMACYGMHFVIALSTHAMLEQTLQYKINYKDNSH